jgi:predicted amidohydrolase
MARFRIAVAQPITVLPLDDKTNVAAAVEWITQAARQGADFICFPEDYPGPWRMRAHYDPAPAIAGAFVAPGHAGGVPRTP